jgi:hypothetical protein
MLLTGIAQGLIPQGKNGSKIRLRVFSDQIRISAGPAEESAGSSRRRAHPLRHSAT